MRPALPFLLFQLRTSSTACPVLRPRKDVAMTAVADRPSIRESTFWISHGTFCRATTYANVWKTLPVESHPGCGCLSWPPRCPVLRIRYTAETLLEEHDSVRLFRGFYAQASPVSVCLCILYAKFTRKNGVGRLRQRANDRAKLGTTDRIDHTF